MQRICLCLNGKSLFESLHLLQGEKYFSPATDVAELRLDFLLDFLSDSTSNLAERESPLQQSLSNLCHDIEGYAEQQAKMQGKIQGQDKAQFVLTLRRQADGGHCPDELSLAEYTHILCSCIQAFPAEQLAYVDIDEAFLRKLSLKNEANGEGAATLWQLLRQKNAILIASLHDFGPFDSRHSPHALEKLLQQLPDFLQQNAVFKLALMTSSSSELLAFYRLAQRFQQSCKRRYILLAMGEYGSSSRILTATISSLWSFCSPETSAPFSPVAPGQISLRELVELYRFRELDQASEIYGVIGDPIAHSRSPQIHNPIYQKYGWNAVYLRFRVDCLDNFLELCSLLPIRGLSCTTPHKEALAERCIAGRIPSTMAELPARASDAVKRLKACNTLYLVGQKSAQALARQAPTGAEWHADNTDVDGFWLPLEEFARKQNLELRGQTAAVIGAGGAARAVVYALLRQGIHCKIYNRTLQKAQDLAELFGENSSTEEQGSQAGWGQIVQTAKLERGANISKNCSLIIQTTTLGLPSKISAEAKKPEQFQNSKDSKDSERQSKTQTALAQNPNDPIPAYSFRAGQIVYDLIYPKTELLRRAEQAGAHILDGEEMLQQQALRQIALFAEARTSHN